MFGKFRICCLIFFFSHLHCKWSRRSWLSMTKGGCYTHKNQCANTHTHAHMYCSSPNWALISHWNCMSAYNKTTSKPRLLKLRISVVRNEVSTGTQLWETHFLTGNALWFCRMRIAQNHSCTQHIGSSSPLRLGRQRVIFFFFQHLQGAHLKKRLG